MSNLILHAGAAVLFPGNDALPVTTPHLGPGSSILDGIFVAGDATNPRIDLIVIQVTDLTAGTWALQSVQGTPSGSPAVPSTPSHATVIAQMGVPAGAASWDACSKTDVRAVASPRGLFNGGSISHSFFMNTSATSGQLLFEANATAPVFAVNLNDTDPLGDTVQFFNSSAGLHRSQVPTIDTSTFNPPATLQLPGTVAIAPTASNFNALLGVVRTLLDAANFLGLIVES